MFQSIIFSGILTQMPRDFKISLNAVIVFFVFALLISGLLRGQSKLPDQTAQAAAVPYKNAFFDPDLKHPWNQLYGLLFIRPAWDGKLYGLDEMDQLYWRDSTYLLEGDLHQKAVLQLEKFIHSGAAGLIKNPLKRALLQRMLWALFDNLANHEARDDSTSLARERRDLETRLVRIMKAVALSDGEINGLPGNYQREVDSKQYPAAFDSDHADTPFLPGGFFLKSDWVEVVDLRSDVVAPVHVRGIDGRSEFHVFMRLPSGHTDTVAYLAKLNDFQPHWITDWGKMVSPERLKEDPTPPPSVGRPPWVNPNLPQVPVLTEFALVRRANLINAKGDSVESPLVESVQIRVIRDLSKSVPQSETFVDFSLDQTKLMQGDGGLVALKKGQKVFERVLEQNRIVSGDSLEKQLSGTSAWNGQFDLMDSCFNCHQGEGIGTMNTYTQLFREQTVRSPELLERSNPGDSDYWKSQRYDWGLLQAYWFAQ